jgi:hypothetical protein
VKNLAFADKKIDMARQNADQLACEIQHLMGKYSGRVKPVPLFCRMANAPLQTREWGWAGGGRRLVQWICVGIW